MTTQLNVKLPADSEQFGAKQRLWIKVPNPAAMLLMGQRFSGDGPFGFTGVTLTTDFDFYIDIKQKTLFQGHQGFVFLTETNILQVANANIALTAGAVLSLAAGGGVVIAGLPAPSSAPIEAKMQERQGEAVPEIPERVDLRDEFVDRTQTVVSDFKGVVNDTADPKKQDLGSTYTKSTHTDNLTRVTDVVKSIKSNAGAGSGPTHAGLSLISKDPIGVFSETSVDTHAATGVNTFAGKADTPASIVSIASGEHVSWGAERAEVFSAKTASLEGGTAADVSSHGPAALLSRENNAIVVGKDVLVGHKGPSSVLGSFTSIDGGKQNASKTVTVAATETITADSDDKIIVKSTNKTTIESSEIEVKGTSKITLKVSSFTIEVTGSALTVSTGGPGKVEVTASKITVTCGSSKVELGPASTKVESTMFEAGGTAMTQLKGGMIKIG